MASNRFIFDGLEELKAELLAMPTDLAGDATDIVMDTASDAKAQVAAVYAQHRVTGTLSNRLKMNVLSIGPYGAAAEVRSTAPHAWLFDNGSQARHYITVRGKKHSTGKMWGKTPPTHVFARTMAVARRRMYQRLRDMLERRGFLVTGQAA